MLKRALLLTCLGGTAATITPVSAQTGTSDANAVPSADIVVTAQRRAERVQDVPIAISVVSADQISRQRVENISDLGRVSASLQMAQTPGGTGGGGYMRGVGTYSRSRGAEASVGVVVDGVVQGLTNVRALSDIARVEVLRGPQGTLFGQSVSAGVLNMTTVAPDPARWAGKIESELSNNGTAGSTFGRQNVRAALNAPLWQDAALRVSGYYQRTEGVLHNIYKGTDDNDTEAGVRAKLLAHAGEKVTINLAAEYNREVANGGGFATPFIVLPGTNPATGSLARYTACGIQPSDHNFNICSDALQRQIFVIKGTSGQIDVDLGRHTLTSITAYRTADTTTNNDIDSLPSKLATQDIASGLVSHYHQFTQELRLASDDHKPLTYTVGGFYMKSTIFNAQGPAEGAYQIVYNGRGALAPSVCWPVATVAACNTAGANVAVENDQHFMIANGSIFGEARYHTGKWTGFAGARYTIANVHQIGFSGAATSDLAYLDHNISWRAGLQYQAQRDLMIYGTVARGYKAGQISPIQNGVAASVVLPEVPTDFEIGVKSSLLHRHLMVNVNGFYTRVKNYQGSSCIVNSTGLVVCYPVNIGRVETKGIEADIFGRITSDLSVNANVIYNVAKYPAGFTADDGTSLAGQQLNHAARFAGTFSVDYAHPVRGEVKVFTSFDLNYKSAERLGTVSNTSAFIYGAHAIIGGRIGLRVDRKWSVAIFGSNLTNKAEPQEYSQGVNQPSDGRNPPLVWGAFQTARSKRLIGLQAKCEF